MDDRRVGVILRMLRRRAGMRQVDVAIRANCHQTTISRAERGSVESLSLMMLRRIFGAVGARFDGEVRWRGGELDWLLDEEHARLVDAVARQLGRWGWTVLPEVSFSEYGERGSVDLLAGHAGSRAAAVFEMKSGIASVNKAIRRHDVKTRLAPKLVFERFGWRPSTVVRVLVLPETTASRTTLAAHATTFRSSYPMTGREIRSWLRSPGGPPAGRRVVGGVWLLTLKHPGVVKTRTASPQRVRRPRPVASEREDAG